MLVHTAFLGSVTVGFEAAWLVWRHYVAFMILPLVFKWVLNKSLSVIWKFLPFSVSTFRILFSGKLNVLDVFMVISRRFLKPCGKKSLVTNNTNTNFIYITFCIPLLMCLGHG